MNEACSNVGINAQTIRQESDKDNRRANFGTLCEEYFRLLIEVEAKDAKRSGPLKIEKVRLSEGLVKGMGPEATNDEEMDREVKRKRWAEEAKENSTSRRRR